MLLLFDLCTSNVVLCVQRALRCCSGVLSMPQGPKVKFMVTLTVLHVAKCLSLDDCGCRLACLLFVQLVPDGDRPGYGRMPTTMIRLSYISVSAALQTATMHAYHDDLDMPVRC